MQVMLAATLSILAAGAPLAPAPIDLGPFPDQTSVDAVATMNFSGTCAGSVVRVLGVTQISGKSFQADGDAGRIIVRDGPSHAIEIKLNDYNGVACVDTPVGKRLLYWGTCGGSACPDDFSFAVYDPKRLTLLTPAPEKGDCDAACATRVLGTPLPAAINRR